MRHIIWILLWQPMFAQSITVEDGCIGVIREAQDATKVHGTGFVAGKHGRVITASHVVPSGQYTFERVGASLKPTERVVLLKLAYQFPEYDLAAFDIEGEPVKCEGCSACPKPLQFGDTKKVRPGDTVFYMGWTMAQGALQANHAIVDATGSALNGSTVIQFLEFTGVGLPGYSGGPVIATDNTIVGVMREAWTKQGVKGGLPELINRAFSIEPVLIRDSKPEDNFQRLPEAK